MVLNKNVSRLTKNSLLLYLRSFFNMLIALFTVKIVLKTLGVVDYGIYNVVAGIVTMLGFLSTTMTGASQRFFSFELGRKDYVKLRKTFSATFFIYVLIAVIVIIIAETVGLWFLNNKMVIPDDRVQASFWVFQFSILSFIAVIMAIPFQSIIIAKEKMKIYAYVGFFEAFLKIIVVYLLTTISFDKLILYAILMFTSTLLSSSIYQIYCLKKFKETKLIFSVEKKIITKILSYAGWNMIGAISNILRSNGINIVLNLFFGPVVNAARAIANQIYVAINTLIINFYLAVRPQITKSFASNEHNYFINLVHKSSKFSYFIVLFITMPIIIETEFILEIWLNQVPQYSVLFTRLILIALITETINNQLIAAIQASGKIKIYQIVISSILMTVLPISYLLFNLGAAPEYAFYVSIVLIVFNFVPQLIIVKKTIKFSIRNYLRLVVLPILLVTISSYPMLIFIHSVFDYGLFRFIVVCFSSVFILFCSIYFFGLSKSERSMFNSFYNNLINTFKQRIKLLK